MMLAKDQIRLAMRRQLETVQGIPDFDALVAWENRDFVPPDIGDDKTVWLRETFIPISEVGEANNIIVLEAIMMYEINTVRGKGTEYPEKLAKAIGDKFKPATSLNDPCKVHIRRSENGTAHNDETNVWYVLPVMIHITAYAYKGA